MQLSPLQSRLAASILASCILLALYLLLFSPHFALAAELSGMSIDHAANSWSSDEGHGDLQVLEARGPEYEPNFPFFDRSITGRATTETTSLSNNVADKKNINSGEEMPYVVEFASISGREALGTTRAELRRSEPQGQDAQAGEQEDGDYDLGLARRDTAARTLWISANTCIQPDRNASSTNTTSSDPPQLSLYVSTSSDNTSPGPSADSSKQEVLAFVEGAVMYNTTIEGDLYLAVAAPNVSSSFTTSLYNFEIAVSTDGSYHSYDDVATPNLYWVDSDASAAMLITNDLNNVTNATDPPYAVFAYGKDDQSVVGVRNSYCGLQEYAQIGGARSTLPANMLSTSMAKRMGNTWRQEFFITGLNKSSSYHAKLVQQPGTSSTMKRANTTTGGGGVVFRETDFNTKSTTSCMWLSNLTFCDQNAYSVPGNQTTYGNDTSREALKQFYDSYAESMYNNFLKAMMQIQCQTEDDNKYSLVKSCDDCKAAYKNWICFVTIPRCEDYSNPDHFLQPRNINSTFPDGSAVDQATLSRFGNVPAFKSSRRAEIDSVVQPGPYKEVLPCDDLCYDIIQSCPSALGFGCPLPGSLGFNTSYGTRQDGSGTTCNYPGSAHYMTSLAALRSAVSAFVTLGVAGCAVLFLLL